MAFTQEQIDRIKYFLANSDEQTFEALKSFCKELEIQESSDQKLFLNIIDDAIPSEDEKINKCGQAQFVRGWLYLIGPNKSKNNVKKAIDYLDQAIEKGNPLAMFHRAYIYLNADKRDYAKAVELLERANNQGYKKSLELLGWIYSQKDNKDYPKAIRYYDEAIKHGITHALPMRAWHYIRVDDYSNSPFA